MAKLKLPKTAKKRFKITGSGRILRRRCGHSHHLEKKTSRKKVTQIRPREISKNDVARVRRLIGLRLKRR
ncbi:MAG: 50S ribosomal protein L35 [Caldiserica bacterium]|nr:MAG: 50S ribosomal protein L35 [Caldisericota bacterium]